MWLVKYGLFTMFGEVVRLRLKRLLLQMKFMNLKQGMVA